MTIILHAVSTSEFNTVCYTENNFFINRSQALSSKLFFHDPFTHHTELSVLCRCSAKLLVG